MRPPWRSTAPPQGGVPHYLRTTGLIKLARLCQSLAATFCINCRLLIVGKIREQRVTIVEVRHNNHKIMDSASLAERMGWIFGYYLSEKNAAVIIFNVLPKERFESNNGIFCWVTLGNSIFIKTHSGILKLVQMTSGANNQHLGFIRVKNQEIERHPLFNPNKAQLQITAITLICCFQQHMQVVTIHIKMKK